MQVYICISLSIYLFIFFFAFKDNYQDLAQITQDFSTISKSVNGKLLFFSDLKKLIGRNLGII
jgi:hypothetical protein